MDSTDIRPNDARMRHFQVLDRAAQADAIRRLAVAGWSEQSIARATQLSVEMIAFILHEAEKSAYALLDQSVG